MLNYRDAMFNDGDTFVMDHAFIDIMVVLWHCINYLSMFYRRLFKLFRFQLVCMKFSQKLSVRFLILATEIINIMSYLIFADIFIK